MGSRVDERMADAPLAGLWIRRQVFEHSVAVPLLTSASASQIDFTRLATELAACSVYMDPAIPPAVSYADWVAAAGLHARLDSSDDACVIIEALETNAPEAFVRCNDPEKLAPGRQLNYRQLNIPVPELLAFVRLHAAATIASRFRETCNASWPEPDTTSPSSPSTSIGALGSPVASPCISRPSLTALPMSLLSPSSAPGAAPMSPRVAQRASSAGGGPVLPLLTTPAGNVPPGSPSATGGGVGDGVVRKKSLTHLATMINSSSAILASVQHSLQRETDLVSRNITHLLGAIAASYGIVPLPRPDKADTQPSSGATVPETGKLVRCNSDGRRRTEASDAARTAVRSLKMTRTMFEHLSFLLTTNISSSGTPRSIATIVPQWRHPESNAKVRIGDLVDLVRAALAREPGPDDKSGPIDLAEFVDLDRKTILRKSFPDCNTAGNSYPHGREVRISNCSDTHFYLLSALGRVSMIACRDCTLFIGASVSVSVINCVNVQVHAVARVCRVTNCFDTHLYLSTNRRPQIVGDNRGLVFAPYNAAYSDVLLDMAEIGVSPNENAWNSFYRPAYRADRGPIDPDLTPKVASVLPPEKFLPFAIPAKLQTTSGDGLDARVRTKSNTNSTGTPNRELSTRGLFSIPLTLPPEYATALAARKHEIDMIRREIRNLDAASSTATVPTTHSESKDVAMSDARENREATTQQSKGLLQAIVQERFREWLTSTGNMRQINDLVRMDQDANGDVRAKTPERQVR